jgi:hypothetical protein
MDVRSIPINFAFKFIFSVAQTPKNGSRNQPGQSLTNFQFFNKKYFLGDLNLNPKVTNKEHTVKQNFSIGKPTTIPQKA